MSSTGKINSAPASQQKALKIGPTAEELEQKAMDELKRNAISLSAKPLNKETEKAFEACRKREDTEYYKYSHFFCDPNVCLETKTSKDEARKTYSITCNMTPAEGEGVLKESTVCFDKSGKAKETVFTAFDGSKRIFED